MLLALKPASGEGANRPKGGTMLRKYEILYILKHDSPPEKTEAAKAKFRDIINNSDGLLVKEDIWGKKKLAFEVKKFSKGIFILLVFLADPTLIAEIERNLKINNEVLRYLTVKLTDKIDIEAEKAEKERWDAEMGRRAQEQAERAKDDSDDEPEDVEPIARRSADKDDDDLDGEMSEDSGDIEGDEDSEN
jgi:small subunit ribosomal protein S6